MRTSQTCDPSAGFRASAHPSFGWLRMPRRSRSASEVSTNVMSCFAAAPASEASEYRASCLSAGAPASDLFSLIFVLTRD